MTSGTLTPPRERSLPSANPHARPPYTCPECGHVLRVSGLGRHRVFFELDDKPAERPIMDRVCPECAHGLPGKNPP